MDWDVFPLITTQPHKYAVYPASQTLVNGTTTFTTFQFRTAGPASFSPLVYSSWTITVRDVDDTPGKPVLDPAISPRITVLPGPVKKLLMILPGETWEPGSATGKTGSPAELLSGATFTITVLACDSYWNACDITGRTVHVYQKKDDTYNPDGDPNAEVIENNILVNGRQIFTGRLLTATTPYTLTEVGPWRITAYSPGSPTIEPWNDPTHRIRVAPGPAVKLLVLVPDEEIAIGTPTGKKGTVKPQRAGVPFPVRVYICDEMWNVRVDTPSCLIQLVTTDPFDKPVYGPLGTESGMVVFPDVEFHRGVGEQYIIIASTADGRPLTKSESSPITSNFGPAVALQILVPGEEPVPGWGNALTDPPTGGKIGQPDPQVADEPFIVRIRITDKYWNRNADVSAIVGLTSTDPFYIPPEPVSISGEGSISTKLVTSTSGVNAGWTLTVSTHTGVYYRPHTSGRIRVLAGRPSRLLVCAPGEEPLPGSPAGKIAPVGISTQTAGIPFKVRVFATDSRYNLADSSAVVRLYSSDIYAITAGEDEVLYTTEAPRSATLKLVNGTTTFLVMARTANPAPLDPINRRYSVFIATHITPPVGPDVGHTLSLGQSGDVPVKPGLPSTLLLLGPEQKHVPGKPPYYGMPGYLTDGGKTGTVPTLVVGTTYFLTVAACDIFWNVTPEAIAQVRVVTSDPYDADATPNDQYLINGLRDYQISLRRATLHQKQEIPKLVIEANQIAGETPVAPAQITNIDTRPTVYPPGLRRLLVLVPNEIHAPGSLTGKAPAGIIVNQTAGQKFEVRVFAVDAYNNIAPEQYQRVQLQSSDPNDDTAVGQEAYSWDPAYQVLEAGTTIFIATLVTANTYHYLIASDADVAEPYLGHYQSPNIWVNPGPPIKLQVLLPGEIHKPNTPAGKAGVPHTQTAGRTFMATVQCVDILWNVNPAANPTVRVETTDPWDEEPTQQHLEEGVRNFPITIRTASRPKPVYPFWESKATHTITAYDVSFFYSAGTSSAFEVVPNSFTRLHITLPGQIRVPGSPTGRMGLPKNQRAGEAFTVTVHGTDQQFNLITTATDTVTLTTQDPYDTPLAQFASLDQGVRLFTVIMVTASTWTITATPSGAGLHANVSDGVYVKPNVPARLQVLAPGEVAAPGRTATRGRTDAKPLPWVAGVSSYVTVNVCDNWYNVVYATPIVQITTDDKWYIAVNTPSWLTGLVHGTTRFILTLATAKETIIRVSTTSASGYSLLPDYTQPVTVNPNVRFRHLIILPGEKYEPGKITGKAGKSEDSVPTAQVAGAQFSFTVYCTDRWYNRTNDNVGITIVDDDPWNHLSPPAQGNIDTTIVNGRADVNLTFRTRNDTGWRIRIAHSFPLTPGPALELYKTPPIPVVPAAPNKLLVLMPGEIEDWGTATGKHKDSVPLAWTAGVPSTVTVTLCDIYNNRVQNVAESYTGVRISLKDPSGRYSNLPITQRLDNGVTTFITVLYTATDIQIRAEDTEAPLVNPGDSAVVKVNPSAPYKLQILALGETPAPGKPPYGSDLGGKEGRPVTHYAGVMSTVTVRAVDFYHNLVNDGSLVGVITEDPWDVHPSSNYLVGGVQTFNITLVTNATWTVTTIDTDVPVLSSGNVRIYNHFAAPEKLQVLIVPDETYAPGRPPYDTVLGGKLGTIHTKTAGVDFQVTVRLVDRYWNQITTAPPMALTILSTDPYWDPPRPAPLFNGIQTFTARMVTAATHTITAIAGGYTGITSTFTVRPNVPTKLLVVLPGESQVNGKNVAPLGRAGKPKDQIAGQTFVATIYAVDDYYNFVSTPTQSINVFTSDPNDTDPSPPSLQMTNGIVTANITMKTASYQTVIAEDADGFSPHLARHESSPVRIKPAAPRRLQVLLPGETAVPGSATGKDGVPSNQVAGSNIPVQINITDEYWNPYGADWAIYGASANVRLMSHGPWANNQPDIWTGVVYGSTTINIQLLTAATAQVEVRDLDNILLPHISGIVNIIPAPKERLLVLLPGEIHAPGMVGWGGKMGTPQPVVAGRPYTVDVRLVDRYFNTVLTNEPTAMVTTPLDDYDIHPAVKQLRNGVETFSVRPIVAKVQQIRVEDVDGAPPLYEPVFSSTFTVTPADLYRVQLILPGETPVPGKADELEVDPQRRVKPYGKMGIPLTQRAGVTFNPIVRLTDKYFNLVNESGRRLRVDTNDPYDIHDATKTAQWGEAMFDTTLVSAGNWHKLTARAVDPIPDGRNSDESSVFTVLPGTATRLQVLLPGEYNIPGKPPYDTPDGGKGGRFFVSPTTYPVAGSYWEVRVNLTDNWWNIVKDAPMPTVRIITSDPKDSEPKEEQLAEGTRLFVVRLLTAGTNYIYAVDADHLYPEYLSSTSSLAYIYPAAVHRLTIDFPDTIKVGIPYGIRITALDQYDNVCSTGPNIYLGQVYIDAETFSADPGHRQNPKLFGLTIRHGFRLKDVPPEQQEEIWKRFTVADAGSKFISEAVELYRASRQKAVTEYRWIKAMDAIRPDTIYGIKTGIFAEAADLSTIFVSPDKDTKVPAGTKDDPGRQAITGQLTDTYWNPITTQAVVVIEIVDVYGSTGVVKDVYGNIITSTMTNTLGEIGVDSPLDYYISTKKGDYARIKISTAPGAAISGVSGRLITIGGVPRVLAIIDGPTNVVAGRRSAPFTVERRDDFGNTTEHGTTVVGLRSDSPAPPPKKKFLHAEREEAITAVVIYPGRTQAQFAYYDELSSWPAGEDTYPNVGAKDQFFRPASGKWTITAFGLKVPGTWEISVDPGKIVKVNFDTPPRTLEAGSYIDEFGVAQPIEVELQDKYNNPRPAEMDTIVNLASDSEAIYPIAPQLISDVFVLIHSQYDHGPYSRPRSTTTISPDIPCDLQLETRIIEGTTVHHIFNSPIIKANVPETYTLVTSSHIPPIWTTITKASVSVKLTRIDPITGDPSTLYYEELPYTFYPYSSTFTVKLEITIQDVIINQPYSFSLSSTTWIHMTDFIISTGSYQRAFYYRDTKASETYPIPGSKPKITASAAGVSVVATQIQNIIPAPINRLVFINPQRTIVAGTTSQLLLLQSQDKYTNPSSVTFAVADPDINYEGVIIDLYSDSKGRYNFLLKHEDIYIPTTTVIIPLGSNLTTFYYRDTLAGIHKMEAVDRLGRGWTKGTQNIKVIPAPVAQIKFVSPPRRLIAGTTIQYYPDYRAGRTTDTICVIQLFDAYDNLTKTTETVTIRLDYEHTGAVIFDDERQSRGLMGVLDEVVISSGAHTAKFYWKSEIAGEPELICYEHPSQGWIDARQKQKVTPNKAHFFSINHPYEKTGLSVRTWGKFYIVARDKYKNIATGDPINGQYYEGTVVFWTNSTSATVNPLQYTFTKADAGIKEFYVMDIMQFGDISKILPDGRALPREGTPLIVGASDYVNVLYGHTGDIDRLSSLDVITVGAVLSPITVISELYQGAGTTADYPSPCPILGFEFRVRPKELAGLLTAQWTAIELHKYGDLPDAQITEVALYKDMNGNYKFDGPFELGGPAVDLLIASGTFSIGYVKLNFPLAKIQSAVTKEPQYFFITVRITADVKPAATLGIEIRNSAALYMMPGATAKTAENNFPVHDYRVVKKAPTKMFVWFEHPNWAAYYDPAGPLPEGSYETLPQGTYMIDKYGNKYAGAGFIKLGLWTPEFTVLWDAIKITHLFEAGGSDADFYGVQIWYDQNEDGKFSPLADKAISKVTPFIEAIATVDIEDQIISPTTKYFFIILPSHDSAIIGSRHAISIIDRNAFSIEGGIVADQPIYGEKGFVSRFVTITPTIDIMYVEWNTVDSPSLVTQGDKNVHMMRLKLYTEERSAIWQGLRLHRLGGGSDSDVAEIKVWRDTEPETKLLGPILSTTTVIPVISTHGFLSKGILTIGNEKMYYVATSSWQFFVTQRGYAGTEPTEHPAGATVLGQPDNKFDITVDKLVSPPDDRIIFVSSKTFATRRKVDYIPILGLLGGQEILTEDKAKTYFITFDIDYFAKVGATYLGLQVPTTYDFILMAPDVTAEKTKGILMFPLKYQIPTVKEYPDIVIAHFDNTLTGALKQGAKNQPILSVQLYTDYSEAIWQGIKITRTGTGRDIDVDRVTIWLDDNNDRLLTPTTSQILGDGMDDLIGQGRFGNTGIDGECLIKFDFIYSTFTQQLLTTRAKQAPRRYFICYDINNEALPETPAGEPATLGAKISFPEDVFVSAPNTISTSTVYIPFASILREIIPSERFVTLEAEPLNITYLTRDLRLQDNVIFVESTAGFPEEGSLAIGDEVIIYNSKTANSFIISRRLAPKYHPKGSIIAKGTLQGEINFPVMKLRAYVDSFIVKWFGLKLDRRFYPSFESKDNDISAIKVWLDDGDGVFNRHPETGENISDIPISMGCSTYLVANITDIDTELPVASVKNFPRRGYLYIIQYSTITQRHEEEIVIYTDIDVYRNKFLNVYRAQYGTIRKPFTKGAIIRGPAIFGPPYNIPAVSYIELNDPFRPAAYDKEGNYIADYLVLTSTPKVLFITFDIDPSARRPDTVGIEIKNPLYLTIGAVKPGDGIHTVNPFPSYTSGIHPIWTTMDTMHVRLINMLGLETRQYTKELPAIKIEVYTNKNSVIWKGLRLNRIGTGIDADVGLSREPGGIKVYRDYNYNGVFDAGDVLVSRIFTFSKGVAEIMFTEPQNIFAKTAIYAGETYFVTFDISEFASVGKTIGAAIPAATTEYFIIEYPDADSVTSKTVPFETNTPIIKEYDDIVTCEPSNMLEAGTEIFQVTPNVGLVKLKLKTDISIAKLTGIRLTRIGFGAPGQPVTGRNEDVGAIKIFKDTNADGKFDTEDIAKGLIVSTSPYPTFLPGVADPKITITLTEPQEIRPSPIVLFLCYDVALNAHAGNLLGVKIEPNAFIFENPRETAMQSTKNLPFDSNMFVIRPLKIYISPVDIAPKVGVLPKDKDVPFLKLHIRPGINKFLLSRLKIQQIGDIDIAKRRGIGLISRVAVYEDLNDNDKVDFEDELLGAATDYTEQVKILGYGYVPINQIITQEGKKLLITVDVAEKDITDRLSLGKKIGIKINAVTDVIRQPETSEVSVHVFPIKSSKVKISLVIVEKVQSKPKLSEKWGDMYYGGKPFKLYQIESTEEPKDLWLEEAWTSSLDELSAKWSWRIYGGATLKEFRYNIGKTPEDAFFTAQRTHTGYSTTIDNQATETGLTGLEHISNITRLEMPIDEYTTIIPVISAAGFPPGTEEQPGILVIGREICTYTARTDKQFLGVKRGQFGTIAQKRPAGTVVSDKAYFFNVSAVASLFGKEAESGKQYSVIRIDVTPPTAPCPPHPPGVPEQRTWNVPEGKLVIQWRDKPPEDRESGLLAIEVQERVDTSPTWRTVAYLRDLVHTQQLILERPLGHFYQYRVRARNKAGLWSPWSEPSKIFNTGLPKEPISQVINYPNPVDVTKGQNSTEIVYLLNQDARVTLTLYDLLGYEVKQWVFQPGENGGRKGPNRITWDLKNEDGIPVSKGGYIAHIKMESDRGLITQVLKIGVIR